MRARSTGRLRYWQQLLGIAGAALWLGAGACSTDSAGGVSLAQPCSIASDCRAPLICAFQLCHNACKEDRDCEGEARCVLGKDGNVCQLEKEIACSQGADCPGSQVCAADGECRDTCKRAGDCTTGQICANSGECASSDPKKDSVDGLGNIRVDSFGTVQQMPQGGAPGNDGGVGGQGAVVTPNGAMGGMAPVTENSAGAGGDPGQPSDPTLGANADDCPAPGAATNHDSEAISTAAIWKGVHTVKGYVEVRAKLTLAPCAVLKMGQGAYVDVVGGGSLQAIGAARRAVTFTSAKAAPAPGDWSQINVYDSASNDSRFEQVVVDYGNKDVVFVRNGASASFSNVTVRNTLGSAIGLDYGTTISEFEGVLVEKAGAGGYPLWAQDELVGSIGSFSSVGSKNQAILVFQYVPVATAATWKNHGLPYALADTAFGNYEIKAPLTLAAGVILRLGAGKGISVQNGGALLATGTADQPVIITSAAATPEAGDWAALSIQGTAATTSRLEHTIIEYGGTNAVSVKDGATLGLSNVSVRHTSGDAISVNPNAKLSAFEEVDVDDAAGYPLALRPAHVDSLTSFTAKNCTNQQIAVYDGQQTKAGTWRNFGVPYRLSDPTYAATWTFLAPVTIEAGTTLLLDGNKYIAIGANGSFKALGTAAKPITIGSSLAVPAPGSWGRITLSAAALGDSILKYTTVKDGSSGTLTMSGSQFALDHATFSGNTTCDVKVSAGTLVTSAGSNTFVQCP